MKLEKELKYEKEVGSRTADNRNYVVLEKNFWQKQCEELCRLTDDLKKQNEHLIRENVKMKYSNEMSKFNRLQSDYNELDQTATNLNRDIMDLKDQMQKLEKEVECKKDELLAKDLNHEYEITDLKLNHEEEINKLKNDIDALQEKTNNLKEGNGVLSKNEHVTKLAFILVSVLPPLGILGIILAEAILVKCLIAFCVILSTRLLIHLLAKNELPRESEYSYSSNVYQNQDMNLNQDNDYIFDQNQMQSSINYQDMNYNYIEQSPYPVFQDDIKGINKELDFPSEEEIAEHKIQSSPANIDNVNVNKAEEVKQIDADFLPDANQESLDDCVLPACVLPAQERDQRDQRISIES